MLTNYHTLRYVASTLHSILPGTTVSQLYSQEKDELVVTLSGEVSRHLIISCRADSNICYLHQSVARARRNTIDIFPTCRGAIVGSVVVLPADRVVHITLSDHRILALQFFGVKANVFFVNRAGIIEDSFRNPRLHRGKEYVAQQGDDIYDITRLALATGTYGTGSLSAVLKDLYPNLGATLVREILFRSGLDLSVAAMSVDRALCLTVTQNLQQVLEEMGRPLPRVYLSDEDKPLLFSIISLRSAQQYKERQFDDVHEAIRFFLSHRRRIKDLGDQQSEIRAKIDHQLEKTRRAIAAAESDLQESNRANEYEHSGALLLANLQNFSRGAHTAELQGTDGPVSIPLDPSLSPTQNAQRYFSKAKRARLARTQAEKRIAMLRRRVTAADLLLPHIEGVSTQSELKTLMTDHGDRFALFGLGKKHEARKSLPFRVFTVDGGFEVWVGKNSANNDLLTLKHAKPNDLWFHARGSSGSHVVLKVGTAEGHPSRRATEQAAGIAAYYSRMRAAKMVPVAMTERKYVRKPKGAPAGTVVLDREKTVFAAPALPQDPDHQQE